ncbi:hypothetical protein BVG19_g1051 [[Candida] boidinii]|nr:hypothetical protein BVG19_g1051 [[Candida] boidinii]OWB50660.1 hypothetical protein B5S27_g2212 [[Candida] boidinii]OWB82735.1 hypothetical protein B5S33_g1363 [[Candida] boidinii]
MSSIKEQVRKLTVKDKQVYKVCITNVFKLYQNYSVSEFQKFEKNFIDFIGYYIDKDISYKIIHKDLNFYTAKIESYIKLCFKSVVDCENIQFSNSVLLKDALDIHPIRLIIYKLTEDNGKRAIEIEFGNIVFDDKTIWSDYINQIRLGIYRINVGKYRIVPEYYVISILFNNLRGKYLKFWNEKVEENKSFGIMNSGFYFNSINDFLMNLFEEYKYINNL